MAKKNKKASSEHDHQVDLDQLAEERLSKSERDAIEKIELEQSAEVYFRVGQALEGSFRINFAAFRTARAIQTLMYATVGIGMSGSGGLIWILIYHLGT